MAADPAQGYRYLELKPVAEGDGWDAEALLKAIGPTTLPPGDNEQLEKAELRRRGWRDPRGLFGYSKDAPYKDLYIYFDAADKSSPVNVAASKAFRCYGLDGKQGVIDWEVIRGPCVLLRGDPPKMTSFTTGKLESMDFPYHPLITPQELVETLLFFKGRDAHKVALKRDAAPTGAMRDIPRNHPMWGAAGPNPGGAGVYVSPAGTRPAEKVMGKDTLACATCGKPNSIACSLKKCSACKSAWYCGQDCQRKDFPRHKRECKALAAAAAEKAEKEKAAKEEQDGPTAAARAAVQAAGAALAAEMKKIGM